MTKTINELRADLEGMEEILGKAFTLETMGESNRSMADMMYRVMSIAARAEILDLALKGALPETMFPRISRAVDAAMEASLRRALDRSPSPLPSPELPPPGQ